MRRKYMAGMLAAVLLLTSCGSFGGGETVVPQVPAEEQTEDASSPAVSFDASKAKASGKKEESVSIKADAAGNVRKTTVTCTLRDLTDDDFVLDQSELTEIRNSDGDEEFQRTEDGTLIWQNLDSDITYEGESTKEAPVSVKIRYFLDGKEVTPAEIEGKSGDVRIRFEYESTERTTVTFTRDELPPEKEEEEDDDEDDDFETDTDVDERVETTVTREVKLPYLFLTMAVLPKDHFKKIEVENGSLSDFGGAQAVIGYALPDVREVLELAKLEQTEDMDIPEFIEIKAQATDFKLEFTETIAMRGLFGELDPEDLDDMLDLPLGTEALARISKELVEGTDKLKDVTGDLKDGVSKYVDGAEALDSALAEAEYGADTLDTNGEQLAEGAAQLADALEKLDASLAQMDLSGMDGSGIDSQTVAMLPEDLQTMLGELSGLSEQLGELQSGLSELSKAAGTLSEGVDAYTEGVHQLADGLHKIGEGTASLAEAGAELDEGVGDFEEGVGKLADGFKEFDEKGIQKLTEKSGDDLLDVLTALRAVQLADKEKVSFSGAAKGAEVSVRYMIETESIG